MSSSVPAATQPAVFLLHDARVDQHRQHLFDIQRIAFGGPRRPGRPGPRAGPPSRAGCATTCATAASSRGCEHEPPRAVAARPSRACDSRRSCRAVASSSTGASSMEPSRLVDQVEQCRLGPVDVVEQRDDRRVGRERLQEAPRAPVDVLDRVRRSSSARRPTRAGRRRPGRRRTRGSSRAPAPACRPARSPRPPTAPCRAAART